MQLNLGVYSMSWFEGELKHWYFAVTYSKPKTSKGGYGYVLDSVDIGPQVIADVANEIDRGLGA
jgi:hypothetical protein